MLATYFLLALGSVFVAAIPSNAGRIIGGSKISIEHYPMGVAMLHSPTGVGNFVQTCAGSIINNRAILSAAHCYPGHPAVFWRARAGSTQAHSGGVVHLTARIYRHAQWNSFTRDNDIAVIHVREAFSFNNRVQPGRIAGTHYNLRDNEEVWAIGWGHTSWMGESSEDLKHVQIWSVNQAVCRQRYGDRGFPITENMLCSGWLDVGGRDQCNGDSGGPLLHYGVIVGVSSWALQCALPRYPGVNTRVSRFEHWIVERA